MAVVSRRKSVRCKYDWEDHAVTALFCYVCLGWPWLQTDPKAAPVIEVTRLVVARRSALEPRERKEAGERFFNPSFLDEGLSLNLTISVPERKIVLFDIKKSRFELKDDQGRAIPLATEFDRKTVAISTKSSPDKRFMTLTLGSHSPPQPGTKYIRVVGQVEIHCAARTETSAVVDLPERQGGQVKIGPLDIKLLEAKLIREGDRQFRLVRLELGRQGGLVGKMEFADAAGNLVENTPIGTMSINGIESRDYRLDPQITRLRIRVTYYSEVEPVMVPIDVKVGPGL